MLRVQNVKILAFFAAEAPTFLKDLSKVQCSDREDVELKIRATGIPRPSVTWLKDGEVIKEDERHQVTTHVDGIVDSAFFIKTFSADDIGTITCKASNVAGSRQTSCELSMALTAPSFGRPSLPRSAEVDEGEPLELKAKVDGSPIPGIAWYKDGEKITPDDHVKINTLPDGTTKLTIDVVKPTDCGAYKLIVSNSSGEDSSLCAVAVTRELIYITSQSCGLIHTKFYKSLIMPLDKLCSIFVRLDLIP